MIFNSIIKFYIARCPALSSRAYLLVSMKFFVSFYRFVSAFFCLAGCRGIITHGQVKHLAFFTYQSNIILGFVMFWAGVATLIKGIQPPAWLKGMITLDIAVTGLVAWLALPPADLNASLKVGPIPCIILLHIVNPTMAGIDFLLFDEHRRMTAKMPLFWMIYFPVYLVFILICAAIFPNSNLLDNGSPYPYGFIDLKNISVQQFLQNIVLYAAAFVVLGYIIYAIDAALPAKTALTGETHKGR